MPTTSRSALRNLIIVFAVAIAVMIYAYGWTVTDIDLSTPQEESRQSNVTLALRELLSPRVFEQDRELSPARAQVLVDCGEGEAPPATTPLTDEPYVIITPTCASEGDIVTVQAFNYAPGAEARIRWIPVEGQSRPREVIETGREEITLSADGGFTGQIEVPRISGSTGQIHEVEFVAATPSGAVRLSDTTNEVLRRMAETIFMAFIATMLAIPISVALSFFAAHNLMKPIRVPLGNMMVLLIGIPIGFWVGSIMLGAVGQFALNLGSGALLGGGVAAVVPFVFVLGATAATRTLVNPNQNDWMGSVRAISGQLIAAVAAVFAIGLLGGLGILGGEQFRNLGDLIRPAQVTNLLEWLVNALGDGIASFGTLIEILGGIVQLFIVPLAGVIGAFVLGGIGVRLTALPMRYATTLISHGLGAVLGAGAGAVLMFAVGAIGTGAALFGILPPLVSAMLAGEIVSLLFTTIIHRARGHNRPLPLDRPLRTALSLAGAVLMFIFTFNYLNVDRAVIDGTLPAANTVIVLGMELSQYVYNSMLIGMVLGAIGAGLAGVRHTFMIGDVLYNITRNILNALRSIEPLIMGLIFVVWVGIGPFAGVLALTLHSIASLGKLYSEQIETIDSGPIEAVQATGANHLQTIVYAVIPQIIPPYIAFTMYRWDINVRMSTIIGFVGGGGIGLLLNQQINLLRYRDAGVAVLAIAIVVSILDYASAKIRERYV
jgi:phosphonate ABC transporter permease subunit PhnE